ncbi:MAG: 50S ribosomal protein L15 [Candidatus Fraserbacteria bacterium RBG_16_55_9]|uniref:Large ribosomal subunit protein uL15 n=1 Tax=Fraserbacteria sp. (strain RBG_16_55_9) TaxID=1817864 RepID=A0A1F5UPG9_FRAXR|nr:ribosomal protein L15 [uncultured bacterium]OGF53009.1 MAG: 50S ribosomal protein L15 [Candidatus Fraserbacteria bacterium RBG_16_55_9]
MLKLEELRPTPGSQKRRKRVGRGNGSGHGTTACRGGKGQTARSGHQMPPGFEGGQTPLWKRVPKRGFRNPQRREYAYVNLGVLTEKYEDGAEVTPEDLLERRIIQDLKGGVKVLAHGELTKKKLIIKAHRFSKKALEKIEQLGAQAIVLESPQRRTEQQPKGREGD